MSKLSVLICLLNRVVHQPCCASIGLKVVRDVDSYKSPGCIAQEFDSALLLFTLSL